MAILAVLLVTIGACKSIAGSGSNDNRGKDTAPEHANKENVNTRTTVNEVGKDKGCLSCHDGIEVISDKMQPYLLLVAKSKYGKDKGYECAICHEGNGKMRQCGEGFRLLKVACERP